MDRDGEPEGSTTDFSRLAALSEQEWFDLVQQSYGPDSDASGLLSGFPSAETQAQTVGSSGPVAMTQAFLFWVDVREACRSLGSPIGPSTRILDFGCGWGRVSRFFLRDVRPARLTGIDVNAEFIATCRRIMSGGTFEVVRPLPPTDLPPESFDLVIGYSVFSHLAELAADAWMREFARILKPGGVVAVTTRSRPFLEYCQSFAGDPHAPYVNRALSRMFPDFDDARRRYDAGEFLYAPIAGAGSLERSFYGEAFIPEGYARRAWAPHLDFREFRFDPNRDEQSLIVLQKPKSAGRGAAAGAPATAGDGVSELRSALEDGERRIALIDLAREQLKSVLREREQHIKGLAALDEARLELQATLQQRLAQADARAAEQAADVAAARSLIDEHEKRIALADEARRELLAILEERNGQIATLDERIAALSESQKDLLRAQEHLRSAAEERERRIALLDSAHAEILRSTSWKLSAPVRAAGRILRRRRP